MNLNSSPKIEELKMLISECSDSTYSHLLYVKKDGEVRIKRFLDKEISSIWIKDNPDDALFWLEEYSKDSGYVGKDAVKDEVWMQRIYSALQNAWKRKHTYCVDFY